MIRAKKTNNGVIIDLTGPQGNAFSLLGQVQNLGRQIGKKQSEIKEIQKQMQSGDYENLLKVFDKEFGDIVILEREIITKN